MIQSARNLLIAALAAAIFVVLLVLVFWVALWLAIVAAAVLAIALLHLVFLPRLARRVRLSTQGLILLLLPLMAAAGWLVARQPLGSLLGLLLWLVAFALPRLVLTPSGNRASWKVEFRFGETGKTPNGPAALAGSTCQRCGMTLRPLSNGGTLTCPRCGAEQTRGNIRVVKPPEV